MYQTRDTLKTMNQLLDTAKRAARVAGSLIMEQYASADFETKSDGSPVTQADMAANESLIAALKETHIPILSEETLTIQTPYPERLWIIDPLDGTKGFIKKTGDFAVMIGLIDQGRPILGVVYVPVSDSLYFAARGMGSWKESPEGKTELRVSTRTEELRFIRSVNHFSPQMQLLSEVLQASLIPLGSIGVKAGLLCEGGGDFFASWGKFGVWDTCAAEIITLEAGGTVTDHKGHKILYGAPDHLVHNGIVFSNGACHAQVLNAIQSIPPVTE